MFRIFVPFLSAILCVVAQAQRPGVAGVGGLPEISPVIVIGSVEEAMRVVNQEKFTNYIRPDKNGNYNLPVNPSDYAIGSLYRIRVSEVLKARSPAKRDKKLATGSVINIFVHGGFTTDSFAGFESKEKYLVLLRPLEVNNQVFAGTAILRFGGSNYQLTTFDPAQCYEVVDDDNGAIKFTQKNSEIIKKVRSDVTKQR